MLLYSLLLRTASRYTILIVRNILSLRSTACHSNFIVTYLPCYCSSKYVSIKSLHYSILLSRLSQHLSFKSFRCVSTMLLFEQTNTILQKCLNCSVLLSTLSQHCRSNLFVGYLPCYCSSKQTHPYKKSSLFRLIVLVFLNTFLVHSPPTFEPRHSNSNLQHSYLSIHISHHLSTHHIQRLPLCMYSIFQPPPIPIPTDRQTNKAIIHVSA